MRFKRIIFLSLLLPLSSSWAIEWERSELSLGSAIHFAKIRSIHDYPSAFGLTLQGDYQVPVFVEGHTRAFVQGGLDWAQFVPDVEADLHGATAYGLSAKAGLLHDLPLGGRYIWLGGGAGLQSLHLVNHYSWTKDGNTWGQQQFDNSQHWAPIVSTLMYIPVNDRLRVDASFSWPLTKSGVAAGRLGLSFRLN